MDYLELSTLIEDGIEEHGNHARLWRKGDEFYMTPCNISEPEAEGPLPYHFDGDIWVLGE